MHGASLLSLTVGFACAQSLPPQYGIKEYKAGGYTFKLMNNDTAGQMWEGQRVIGTIYSANGQLLFLPVVPEPEASKASKAFEDWKATGQKGSQAAPQQPVSFEADGGAIVPLQDGSIVHFSPTFVEITRSNMAAMLPGQKPVTSLKITLKSPSAMSAVWKNSTGIEIDGNEAKPRQNSPMGHSVGGRKAAKLNSAYRPLIDGPVTTAAQLATDDPRKPANALDYMAQARQAGKRIDESF